MNLCLILQSFGFVKETKPIETTCDCGFPVWRKGNGSD